MLIGRFLLYITVRALKTRAEGGRHSVRVIVAQPRSLRERAHPQQTKPRCRLPASQWEGEESNYTARSDRTGLLRLWGLQGAALFGRKKYIKKVDAAANRAAAPLFFGRAVYSGRPGRS